ncbi:MAG TPA: hypothetical protein VNA57_03720 [Acidimicrobiales bacterium]|nr:hypothetical protein [Acidimicrobiales bacterium]
MNPELVADLVLADEVAHRDTNSAPLRARTAGLDPGMRLESWDTTATVRYDQQPRTQFSSPRFLDGPHGALLLSPVGAANPPRDRDAQHPINHPSRYDHRWVCCVDG